MEKNILIDNEEIVFMANHHLDENFQPIKQREVYNKKCRVFNQEVIFCPKCKTMHPIFKTFYKDGKFIFDKKDYPASFFMDYAGEYEQSLRVRQKYVCPSCNTVLSDFKQIFLEKTSIDNGSRTVKSMKIFEPKDDKLIASVFLTYYYPNTTAGKLAVIPMRHRLVFNYKTGKTYFLEGHTLDGKHPKWDATPKILNVTLGNIAYSYAALSSIVNTPQIIKALAESLLEIHGGDKSQLTKIGDFSDTTFPMLTIYNSIPYFNYNFYRIAEKKSSNCGGWDRAARDRLTYKLRMLKKKHQTNDPFIFQKYLLKGTNLVVKKAIKKELFNNPFLVEVYNFAVFLGFKNPDVLRSWMSDGFETLYLLKDKFEQMEEGFKPIVASFVKELIDIKGEAGAYKCLLCEQKKNGKVLIDPKYTSEYMQDTSLMWFMFKERNMLRKEYLKGDLRKIHDLFSRDYKKIRNENKVLSYEEDILLLNDTIGDFSFILAKDTYELIDIGQELHICVGSYGERAASKKLIIVKMMKGNEYVGCIELSEDGKVLRQAKACFNNLLEERKAEALKAWVEKHEIDAETCYDYRHIRSGNISYDENNIYTGHRDYANFGVYVDGDVRRLLRDRANPGVTFDDPGFMGYADEEDNNDNQEFMHIPDADDDWGDLPF